MANRTTAPDIKAELVTALRTLFPVPVKVSYGAPWGDLVDEFIAVGNMESRNDLATMGTPRSREETVQITITISCWSGSPDQQVVTERAYSMLQDIEEYLQLTDPTLAGTVRTARVVSHALTETAEPDDAGNGRYAEVEAVIECRARLT